jgi:membrane-bound serine protease (ClpP class)
LEGGEDLKIRRSIAIFSFLFAFILMILPFNGNANNETVYVVPIEERNVCILKQSGSNG